MQVDRPFWADGVIIRSVLENRSNFDRDLRLDIQDRKFVR